MNPPSLTGRRPAAVATSLRGAWGGVAGAGVRACAGGGGRARSRKTPARASAHAGARNEHRGRTRGDGRGMGGGGEGGGATPCNAPEPSQRLYRVRDLDVGVGLVRLARGQLGGDASLPLMVSHSQATAPPRRNPEPAAANPGQETGSGGARGAWNERRTRRARARRRTAGEEGSEAKKTELRTCFVLKLAASRATVVQSAAPPPADAHRGRRTFFFRE